MIKPKDLTNTILTSLLKEYPEHDLSKIDLEDFWEEAWERIVDELGLYGISITHRTPEMPQFLTKEPDEILSRMKMLIAEKIEERIKEKH